MKCYLHWMCIYGKYIYAHTLYIRLGKHYLLCIQWNPLACTENTSINRVSTYLSQMAIFVYFSISEIRTPHKLGSKHSSVSGESTLDRICCTYV